jgi:hypothetical protein
MPRVYMDKFGHGPLYTIVNGVGRGMKNDPTDVMLVQCFLIALLKSNRAWLGTDEKFTPPPGAALDQTGVWDAASARYLERWEGLRNRAQNYWSRGNKIEVQFPGTVVPYHKGGQKIVTMNGMAREFYGDLNYLRLDLGGVRLRREAAMELFYDPIRGPYDFQQVSSP